MNRLLRAFACVIPLCAAAQVAQSAPQSFTTNIARIYSLSNGNLTLLMTSDDPACTSINSPHYYKVVLGENGVTADGLRLIYATAMTAVALGRQVSLYFDDATSNCFVEQILLRQ
ncbi:MAG: hypothetical protein ACREQV_03650 [Candidatus Binatia bacterium]